MNLHEQQQERKKSGPKPYRKERTSVEKAKLALFWKGKIISGDCTFVGRKYKDGEIVLDITFNYDPNK